MKILKRPSPGPKGLGVKARAYRQLQNRRAVFLSIIMVAAATVLVFLCKPQTEPTLPSPNNWGQTRAFSAIHDPSELLKVFRASYAAHQLYVLKNEVAAPLAALDHAVDNVRSEAELRSAMQRLVAATKDRFAEMIDATQYETLMAVRAGHRIGVGLEFAFDMEVETPTMRFSITEGEIEAGHGLDPMDVVLKVDGESVDTIPGFDKGEESGADQMLTEYANLGLLGSKLKLTVLRDGAEVEVELTRHIVEKAEPFRVFNMSDPSIRQGVPAGRVIQITSLFDAASPAKFAETLLQLAKDGIKGVVVDVASVKGGDPEVALRFAAMLIDKGVIAHRVEVTDAGEVQMLTWEAKDGSVILRRKGPFAVSAGGKIDTKSASAEKVTILSGWKSGLWKGDVIIVTGPETEGAPELIAAAMRTREIRGPLVGETTAGKGMSQSHFNVGADTILGVSTGFYLAPDGTSIQDHGVEPQVQVDISTPGWMMAQYLMAQRFKVIPLPKYPELTK